MRRIAPPNCAAELRGGGSLEAMLLHVELLVEQIVAREPAVHLVDDAGGDDEHDASDAELRVLRVCMGRERRRPSRAMSNTGPSVHGKLMTNTQRSDAR